MIAPVRLMPILMIFFLAVSHVRAQATQPDGAGPATQPVKITPQAQKLLDGVRDAYAKLHSLELAGTYRLELDMAAQQQDNRAEFSASFVAPNRFRHEMTDDALIVSNGTRAYLFVPRVNRFDDDAAPKTRGPAGDLPDGISQVLRGQNPSLRAAICDDAAAALIQDAQSATRLPDRRVDQIDCPVLELTSGKQRIEMVFDPASHLLKRVQWDLSAELSAREIPDVRRAIATVEYTKINPSATIADGTFAWKPPPEAAETRKTASREGARDPASLEGKPAPGFTLKDLEDHAVSLASLRGSVVVLDFWATWCPPCRESLPHLAALHQEFGERGVRVYAVNVREGKDAVQQYLEQSRLALQVLLDSDGKVADRYAVGGIPQTVVVGKNGAIRNVFVGFGADSDAALRNAVQQALQSN